MTGRRRWCIAAVAVAVLVVGLWAVGRSSAEVDVRQAARHAAAVTVASPATSTLVAPEHDDRLAPASHRVKDRVLDASGVAALVVLVACSWWRAHRARRVGPPRAAAGSIAVRGPPHPAPIV